MTDVHHDHAAHGHGAIDLKKYVAVFVALCVLSAMSFFTYSDLWPSALDTPSVKRLFMMAVSCTKAMLVILFFMHLKYEANWKYVLTVPASIMSVLLVLLLVPDIGARINGFRWPRLGIERAGGRYSIERRRMMPTDEDAGYMHAASNALAAEHEQGLHGRRSKGERKGQTKKNQRDPNAGPQEKTGARGDSAKPE